jgi:serine/threonine-protein kinase HipA
MIEIATIKLWSQPVGVVSWDANKGIGVFEFYPRFKKSGLDVSPFMMPISSRTNTFSFPDLRDTSFQGLPGLLADSLPDRFGNELINSWLLSKGRPEGSLNPVEKLCFIGTRSIGAMEFEPATPKQNDKSKLLEIDSMISLVSEIMLHKRTLKANLKNQKGALKNILQVGTSAGGQRAKAIIAYNTKAGDVRSGHGTIPKGFEHYILKFDGVKDKVLGSSGGWGKVEMAYHKMALAAGIDMMPSLLIHENKRAHFITKRFDRVGANGKLHAQTFGALKHHDYNNPTRYSYEDLFATTIQLGCRDHLPQLFRRMVFNVLSMNCDDHVKNFSFLMDRAGNWSLSPAYDICHSYNPNSPWTSQHNLSVGGKRAKINVSDLKKFADSFRINKTDVIIDDVSRVVKNWESFAQEQKVATPIMKDIKRTLGLVV